MTTYPKRLIEVDLPIKEISASARKEKAVRRGHPSTLHLWWSRKPLASSRAVICAALWPDPVDAHCPAQFRETARRLVCDFADKVRTDAPLASLCQAHWRKWRAVDGKRLATDDSNARIELRELLLAFIADFAAWEATDHASFADTARALSESAVAGESRLLIDPFSGGGSIPLEGLRLGLDVFASDLNPVAGLMNRVLLEYIPRYGTRLSEAVRTWGEWVHTEARRSLASYYADDVVAYLWARTIRCEGPACGVEIPLLNSLWVSKKAATPVSLSLKRGEKNTIRIALQKGAPAVQSTVAKGHATCPLCNFTTPGARVRAQLKARRGGTADARMFCVVTLTKAGRVFREPNARDVEQAFAAQDALARDATLQSLVPDELIPQERVWRNNPIRVHLFGLSSWGDLFSPRQQLTLATYTRLVREAHERVALAERDPGLADAVEAVLALSLSRFSDICNAMCRWESSKTQVRNLFVRQAISMQWGFAEPAVFTDGIAGNYLTTLSTMVDVVERTARVERTGQVWVGSATQHPLPDDCAALLVTDPPYSDAVPYATISDFFYVWLKRAVPDSLKAWFARSLIDKDLECVIDEAKGKDDAFFRKTMTGALTEARRVVAPSGVGVVMFAHKSTAVWEAQLSSMLEAGWVVTASWPIDTELGNRMRAQDSAVLGSTIHLVCRPRENPDGSVRTDAVGDWRAVLRELPMRIHDWLPRLSKEGIVGADAIFACLGPALEIFSQFSRVEKSSGELVTLREYLEQVWAEVAREALSLIFEGADASGLEEDARLTAMWLWTLGGGANGANSTAVGDEPGEEDPSDDAADDGGDDPARAAGPGGFVLEYDAARKIAQGLGAHLEKLANVVEIRGDDARLLSVGERAKLLLRKVGRADAAASPAKGKGRAKSAKKQLGLFAEIEAAEKEGLLGDAGVPSVGETTLDRVHQTMILFAAGRSEALRRFVVDEGVGKDARFWKLAQSLSALYPASTDEKRWVDGVLARKKSLGF